MTVTLDQARAIMQAVTIDIWNNPSKPARLSLMDKYCACDMKAYAPDGIETNSHEECDGAYDKLHADDRSDWKFEPRGDLWMNCNMLMQRWFFGKGEDGWNGWDVIILDGEGKVEKLYGLVDGMHNHQ